MKKRKDAEPPSSQPAQIERINITELRTDTSKIAEKTFWGKVLMLVSIFGRTRLVIIPYDPDDQSFVEYMRAHGLNPDGTSQSKPKEKPKTFKSPRKTLRKE